MYYIYKVLIITQTVIIYVIINLTPSRIINNSVIYYDVIENRNCS